jgi:hypothetical protein
MRKWWRGCVVVLFFILFLVKPIWAVSPTVDVVEEEATESAEIIEEVKEVEVKEKDITEPTEEVKGRLQQVLDEYPVGDLNWYNWLQVSIRQAVDQGVPPNTIVLLLMFPAVAGLVAIARQVVGIKGFGIYLPALMAVALLSMGLVTGLGLFLGVVIVAMLSRRMLKWLKLQYLPRMALMIWVLSMVVLGVLMMAPNLKLMELVNIGVFPILLVILLTEDFVGMQSRRGVKEAIKQLLQTMFLAIVSYFLLSWSWLQEWVLVRPEMSTLIMVAMLLLVGKYSGLRLLEYRRFRRLFKK